MGTQVGFYADETDLGQFLSYASGRGFRALPRLIASDEPSEGISPSEFTKAADAGTDCFYLLPPDISAAEVFYGETADVRVMRVIKHVSPVTELRPSPRKGNDLSNGRIHFNMGSHVTHHEEGRKGFERLARYLREWRRTSEYQFYVGPHTADAVATGHLHLVHWNERLSLAEE